MEDQLGQLELAHLPGTLRVVLKGAGEMERPLWGSYLKET
jgi:hypothetical protein